MTIRPAENDLTEPYWAASRRGVVLLQRCRRCRHCWHPPSPVCVACQSTDVAWEEACGEGVIHTFTIVRRAAHRALDGRLPYLIGVVRLAEGPLLLTNIVGDDAQEVAVGTAVRLTAATAAGGERLVCARLDQRDH